MTVNNFPDPFTPPGLHKEEHPWENPFILGPDPTTLLRKSLQPTEEDRKKAEKIVESLQNVFVNTVKEHDEISEENEKKPEGEK